MIIGAHAILNTTDAEADRAFLRDVLSLPFTDVGGGWLIFALPPSELACHPAERGGEHQIFLMCQDIEAFRAHMAAHNTPCSEPETHDWGILVQITLPSGAQLGVYEPRHARPPAN